MINSASHDNVSRLVTDRSMCFATALDKAFENIDCMSVILRCQAKNRFYESTQRLIQPRRVLWASPFKSKSRLEAENAVLRHQLIVLRRKVQGRVRLTNNDRWFLIQLYRWFPSILKVLTIVQPETLVRWHRAGFRCYWRWKSRPRGGCPQIETDLRALIRRMSIDNPLWGAPRIHGELLKLGFEVAQSSVAKYMVKRRGP